MKKYLVLLCVALIGMMAFTPQVMADDDDDRDSGRLDITRAEWRSDGRTLTVYAVDSSTRNRLTATYNGQTYNMNYDSGDRRFELRVSSVCYANQVTVRSSSGATDTASVSDRDGRGANYSCTAPTPPPGGSTINVSRADWAGDRQRLYVYATSASRGTLTASYNGETYTMRYSSDRRRYELRLEPICYASNVTVTSSAGGTVTSAVADTQGRASSFPCTTNPPDPDPGPVFGVTGATWTGDRQRLQVRAVEGDGAAILTVTYFGASYPMIWNSATSQYELNLEPICYSGTATVESSSGESASVNVADPQGAGASQPCGGVVCPDNDGDGFPDAGCGGTDCNDNDPTIYPGAPEICFDGIDQACTGTPDQGCTGGGSGPHANLTYAQYPANCVSCHSSQAAAVMQSTHYTWLGDAPDMVNGVGLKQGKMNAMNSYCVSILGDWPVCGSCHVGKGKRPDDATANNLNVDCLSCHNADYAAQRVRLADGSMGVPAPTDALVRNVGKPVRAACLSCHAKAGGGDGNKRGDLSLALATNANATYDNHMNTAGANLDCQSCHVFQNHRTIGKGSDLRATDDLTRGSRVNCTTCHTNKTASNGHATTQINTHVGRVACQVCHIPTYGKLATETTRDWRRHADGSPADGVSGPGHPFTEKAANLIPKYKFWTGKSDNALLFDDASRTRNATTGNYVTSNPIGGINDANSKLYPFKYKTAATPMTNFGSQLIAVDTFEYLKASGNITTAIQSGLGNMGLQANEPYTWVNTETYQMINHGVTPASSALACTACHGSTTRINLKGELGYQLKAASSSVCGQCHSSRTPGSFQSEHDRHVRSRGYDCAWCHNFSRPERGLRRP